MPKLKTTIPSVKNLSQIKTASESKVERLNKFATRFLNEVLKRQILEAVPTAVYEDLDAFCQICIDTLEPLGYKAEKSYGGAGIYETLFVSWK
jgi:hypothetical protein